MKIVCATNMPLAAEAFAMLGDVTVVDGRRMCAEDVRDAALLAVRSTTRVGSALLDGSHVRFVGTATIGADHLDIPYLAAHGIHWACAPGCNANSVAEYVAAGLLCLADRHEFTLAGKTIGIIGVGNVGSRVASKAAALGMRVLLNDPPRARRGDDVATAAFVDLDRTLAGSDVVSLHVPLTREGPAATHHLADAAFFARLKPGAIVINTARGPIVDTDALIAAMRNGIVAHAIVDTWEGEPAYRLDLLRLATIATPHIAGYSYDGRVNGTVMIYQAACRHFGVTPEWTAGSQLPTAPLSSISLAPDAPAGLSALHDIVRRVYDISADDADLRAGAHEDARRRADAFDRLRKTYRDRREFPFTRIDGSPPPALRAALAGLGFPLRAM